MENNENTLENTEIPSQTDSIQPSPSDNTVTETVENTQTETETTEETIVEEETAGEELTEETTDETMEKETEVIVESPAPIDYTETLLAISEHTQLTSARVEYANCLLIVIILVIILNYAYKFFKMFF